MYAAAKGAKGGKKASASKKAKEEIPEVNQ